MQSIYPAIKHQHEKANVDANVPNESQLRGRDVIDRHKAMAAMADDDQVFVLNEFYCYYPGKIFEIGPTPT